MKLCLDQLDESPKPLTFEGGQRWWRERAGRTWGADPAFGDPVRFDVRAYKIGEQIVLEGDLGGTLDLECSRCLARYRHALRESFRLILEAAGARTPSDPEGAAALTREGLYLGDELEVGWYRGSDISLEAYFAELVSLAWPVKPLCREDCPGLCPRCGARLAETTCECPAERPDSPFAVLASLRDAQKKEEG